MSDSMQHTPGLDSLATGVQIENHGDAITDDTGRVVGHVGQGRDVSECERQQ